MPFPRRLLIEGEELVLDLRPHWIALVMPSVVTALVIVGYILALAYAPDDGGGRSVAVWGAFVVGLAILAWYPLRAFIAWATSNFAVTTDRIIHREGFIAKRSMEIPLEAINDVRFQQSILERIVGAGDLVIQSASEYGRNVFANVRNPRAPAPRRPTRQGRPHRGRVPEPEEEDPGAVAAGACGSCRHALRRTDGRSSSPIMRTRSPGFNTWSGGGS